LITFHLGKEEKAYFLVTKSKDGYSEDICKFLIEHELGRRIANMLRREIQVLKSSSQTDAMLEATEMKSRKKSLSPDFSSPMLYLLMTTQERKTYSLIC
jgi:hypothetical protein